MNIDRILAAGLSRGLRMEDSYQMDLGMWIDFIIEFNNMQYLADKELHGSDKPRVRKATQADFDAF